MLNNAFPLPGLAGVLPAALLGWVLGAALQLQQPDLLPWQVYMGIGAIALVGCAWSASKTIADVVRGAVVLVALALLGFAATGLRASAYLADALDPALEGRDLRVTGVVTDLPRRSDVGLRFRLDVESATLDGAPAGLPPRMDVAWYGGVYAGGPATAVEAEANPSGEPGVPLLGLNRQPADLRAGERWTLTVRVKAPHGARNPHGFDYELYLWEQGVQATGYVRAGPRDAPPQRLAQTGLHPVAWARQSVRERIERQVQPRALAGVIAALVVGDQAAIERGDWDVFRATGVAHLVSISGLHITMFAWGAALAVGWLWRRSPRLCRWWPAPFAALCGGVLLASAYAFFSGWGVPAQRTCLMLATVAALRLSGARWPWQLVWLLACAVVVASDPWALLQAGFWLSFVAVGVLFATDSGAAYAHSTGAGGLFGKVIAGLREQWVITVALTPLTLLLFGQVSLVGLAANAIAIPVITLLVTPLAMLGVFLPALWDLAAGAMGFLMQYLQWLAHWPWATLALAMPPLWVAVLGVFGGLLMVLPWPWSMRALGLPMLLPVLLWHAPLPAPGQFELLAADVGQGNAVLVRTATHALLYDAGPRYSLESDAGNRVLAPLMQALDTRLDTLVLSHRDTDHTGGAVAVLTSQPQAALLSSIAQDNPLQALRPAKRCEAGQHWEWDGVQFDILHPQAVDYAAPAKPNAMSCVLRIGNGTRTALLVGDIEQPQEARLVQAQADLKADVLLLPHHGSKTSSSTAFLDAVKPEVAIVQAGYRNRFGHPAAPVLERLRARDVATVDSPHCGAYTWFSDPSQLGACTRVQGLRYWHHRVP